MGKKNATIPFARASRNALKLGLPGVRISSWPHVLCYQCSLPGWQTEPAEGVPPPNRSFKTRSPRPSCPSTVAVPRQAKQLGNWKDRLWGLPVADKIWDTDYANKCLWVNQERNLDHPSYFPWGKSGINEAAQQTNDSLIFLPALVSVWV